MMPIGITPRQAECLSFIDAHIAEHRVSPSLDEIAAELKVSSKSGVHRLLCALEDRGRIRRLQNKTRSIEVLHPESGADENGRICRINPELSKLVVQYASEEGIKFETAVNALLRGALGADR